MTIIELILIIVAVLLILAGVLLMLRGGKSNNASKAEISLPDGVQEKDGVPILPREMRQFDEPELASDVAATSKENIEANLEANLEANIEKSLEDSAVETQQTPQDMSVQGVANDVSQQYVETHQASKVEESTHDAYDLDAVKPATYEEIQFPKTTTDTSTETAAAETIWWNETVKETATEEPAVQAVEPVQTATPIIPAAAAAAVATVASTGKKTDIEPSQTAIKSEVAQTSAENSTMAVQAESPASIEKADFADNSPVLDNHLLSGEQKEQNSPLHNAEYNLNISIIPNNEFASFKGKELLKLADDYGFKYGAMNMFHRYQEKDGSGTLWFSMMGLGKDGIKPFDLNTLISEEYKGLVLFLPLPHPKVFQGFDSMMSIASLMARELDAYIVDENGKPMTANYKKTLRSQLEEVYGVA